MDPGVRRHRHGGADDLAGVAGRFPKYIGLSTLYSGVLGLIVGLVLRRQFMKEPSSRAARAIAPVARVEPPRFAALK